MGGVTNKDGDKRSLAQSQPGSASSLNANNGMPQRYMYIVCCVCMYMYMYSAIEVHEAVLQGWAPLCLCLLQVYR